MQKKLLTMAVAGALAAPSLALAQMSGTEVYGTVNMAFGNFKYSDGTGARTNDGANPAMFGASVSKWDVANGASNYGVRSRESLGGGLSGWVQIEQNAPLERESNQAIKPASRNSAIGLQGGFGNFFIGQWTTPWADLDALWSIGTVGFWGPVTSIIGRRETTGTAPNYNCANGDGTVAGGTTSLPGKPICDALQAGGGVGHAFWRRFSNAIFYQSNVMAGVQAKIAYMTNEGRAQGNPTTNANASAWSASVQWAGMGGRARVGAALDRHKDFTTIGATDSGYSVKGGFNFGVVDLGLAWETMKYKCGVLPFGVAGAPTFNANGSVTYATLAPGRPALCGDTGDVKAKQYGIALAVPVGPGSIRASYSVAKDLTGVVGANTAGGLPLAVPGAHISDTGAKQFNIGYEHRFSKRTNIGVGYAKIDNKQNAQFTWTGAPPNQTGGGGTAAGANTPLFGSDVSTFFLSMTHRF
jgi:predicted porin